MLTYYYYWHFPRQKSDKSKYICGKFSATGHYHTSIQWNSNTYPYLQPLHVEFYQVNTWPIFYENRKHNCSLPIFSFSLQSFWRCCSDASAANAATYFLVPECRRYEQQRVAYRIIITSSASPCGSSQKLWYHFWPSEALPSGRGALPDGRWCIACNRRLTVQPSYQLVGFLRFQ